MEDFDPLFQGKMMKCKKRKIALGSTLLFVNIEEKYRLIY